MRISSAPTAIQNMKKWYPIEKLALLFVVLVIVAVPVTTARWLMWQREEKENRNPFPRWQPIDNKREVNDAQRQFLDERLAVIRSVDDGVLLVPKIRSAQRRELPNSDGLVIPRPGDEYTSDIWQVNKVVSIGFVFGATETAMHYTIIAIDKGGITLHYDNHGHAIPPRKEQFSGEIQLNWK